MSRKNGYYDAYGAIVSGFWNNPSTIANMLPFAPQLHVVPKSLAQHIAKNTTGLIHALNYELLSMMKKNAGPYVIN